MVLIFFIHFCTLLSSIKVNYLYNYNQSSIIIKVIFSEKLKTILAFETLWALVCLFSVYHFATSYIEEL